MRRKRRKPVSDINVVPYIDVMLVLLIIFMVTAPLMNLGVELDLPQANANPLETPEDPVVVSVDRDGALSPAELQTHAVLSAQLPSLDRDGDGRLSRDELAGWL